MVKLGPTCAKHDTGCANFVGSCRQRPELCPEMLVGQFCSHFPVFVRLPVGRGVLRGEVLSRHAPGVAGAVFVQHALYAHPPAHIGRLAPKATRFGNIRNFCALCPKAFLQESSPQNKGKRAGGLREGLATRLSGLRTCALGKRDCSEQARHDTATCAAPLLSNSACERWVGSGRRRPPPRHA